MKELPNYVALSSTDKLEINNELIEARFTHLSPSMIKVNSWKFVMCTIAAFQKEGEGRKFMSEMRDIHQKYSREDIRNLAYSYFDTPQSRQVTLHMQDIATVSTTGSTTAPKKKSYNRKHVEATIHEASTLHMTTASPASLAEWAKYRAETASIDDPFASPLENWGEWHNVPNNAFTGRIFDSIYINKNKPHVTMQFSQIFLRALLTNAKYTKLSLEHLSGFKSLAGLRLYQALLQLKGKSRQDSPEIRLNRSLLWWRSFYGVGESIQVTIHPTDQSPPLNKETQWHCSIANTWRLITNLEQESEKLGFCTFKPEHAQVFYDSLPLIKSQALSHRKNSKQLHFSVLVEHLRGKYPEFKKLHQNVLKKAIEEVNLYHSGGIKITSSGAKRHKASTTATSFNLLFKQARANHTFK